MANMTNYKTNRAGLILSMRKTACYSVALLALTVSNAFARDLELKANQAEFTVYVTPGEPTQVTFPGAVLGGYQKNNSKLALQKNDSDVVIFANQDLSPSGESLMVRLQDGRSYSVRAKRALEPAQRDQFVNVFDKRSNILEGEGEDELPAYKEQASRKAPNTAVSGLMRELMLAAEFGKSKISGYTKTDRYKGQVILNDGTMLATVESIFIGPTLWGYVIDAANMLDQTQKINPATFRLDGTRAISASQWELAPRPNTVEQEVAARDKTKIYIVTKARR